MKRNGVVKDLNDTLKEDGNNQNERRALLFISRLTALAQGIGTLTLNPLAGTFIAGWQTPPPSKKKSPGKKRSPLQFNSNELGGDGERQTVRDSNQEGVMKETEGDDHFFKRWREQESDRRGGRFPSMVEEPVCRLFLAPEACLIQRFWNNYIKLHALVINPHGVSTWHTHPHVGHYVWPGKTSIMEQHDRF